MRSISICSRKRNWWVLEPTKRRRATRRKSQRCSPGLDADRTKQVTKQELYGRRGADPPSVASSFECHCQEWLLHHLGCLNDVPSGYGITSPSQNYPEQSNIISGKATLGSMSTTHLTSPTQQLLETYFNICVIFPSPTICSIPFIMQPSIWVLDQGSRK